MAFVSQADRGITQISKSIDTIGPGSYNIDHPKQGGYSCAPFWSTSTRRFCSEDKMPGPGAYSNPNVGWPHTMTTYSNNNNIIIKLNTLGTPPFQSKILRFPQKNEETPGPADYQVQRKHSLQQRRPRIKSNKLFSAIPNAPSITKVNYLSERRAKTEECSSIDLPKKKGVLAGVWGKDKCKRFSGKCVTEVGPGSYDLPIEFNQTKKGISGSNSFLSSTVRTFDTIIYQARNAETLAMRKLQNYHSEQPAPGSYNLNNNKNVAAPQYKNHTFGSTLQRFGRSKTEESAPFYEVGSSFQQQKFHKKNVPFNSESKKIAEKYEPFPGPGYYSVDHQQNFVTRRYIQCFGSTAKRSLDEPRGNQKLGPGCYQPSFKRALQVQQSSVFASKQPRSFQVTPNPDNKFAAYQVGKDDISHKAMEQRVHRQNLQKINCAKPAFDKQTPRFAHYEQVQEKPKKLTSQQLEYLMRQRKEEQRNKSIEAARAQVKTHGGAMPRGERFKQKKGGPGVGDYALRSNWTKKSYNIKYSLGQ